MAMEWQLNQTKRFCFLSFFLSFSLSLSTCLSVCPFFLSPCCHLLYRLEGVQLGAGQRLLGAGSSFVLRIGQRSQNPRRAGGASSRRRGRLLLGLLTGRQRVVLERQVNSEGYV